MPFVHPTSCAPRSPGYGIGELESNGEATQDLEQRKGWEDAGELVIDDLVREAREEFADPRLLATHVAGRGRIDRRITQQIECELFVRNKARLTVERPDHVGERLETHLERLTDDRR